MKSNARRPASRAVRPGLIGGLALIAALGSCSAPPVRPAPGPPPAPAVIRAPRPLAPAAPLAWTEAPVTPGDWQWQPGTARYVRDGQALFSLECARAAGEVRLVRHGLPGGAGTLEVATTTLTRPLAARPGGDGAALVAEVAVRDPLLDAVAFSRARFAVEASGQEPLVLPAWPEVARVIEDCR